MTITYLKIKTGYIKHLQNVVLFGMFYNGT